MSLKPTGVTVLMFSNLLRVVLTYQILDKNIFVPKTIPEKISNKFSFSFLGKDFNFDAIKSNGC